MKFSAPMWFTIKCLPNIGDGAKHAFRVIQPDTHRRQIARKTVQRNAFFAHPECVLSTMMADSDLEVRCQAVHVIAQEGERWQYEHQPS